MRSPTTHIEQLHATTLVTSIDTKRHARIDYEEAIVWG